MKQIYKTPMSNLAGAAFLVMLLLMSCGSLTAQTGTPDVVITVEDQARCKPGSLEFTATVSEDYDESKVHWYKQPFYGEPVAVGPTFTTERIQQTTAFYVDYITDEGCMICERVKVMAIIIDDVLETRVFYDSDAFCNSADLFFEPTIVPQ